MRERQLFEIGSTGKGLVITLPSAQPVIKEAVLGSGAPKQELTGR